MKFDDEFKKAISMLPPKEKDKLILRLLRRDLSLANRLMFELVSTDSVVDRRTKAEDRVKLVITQASKKNYSLGQLMMIVRDLSGEITEHVSTTKDKQGEASLNLLMLNELISKNSIKIEQDKLKNSYKISIYIIARTFKILTLIKALHEDLFIEFEDELIKLGDLMSKNTVLMGLSIRNGLDVNWLTQAAIPNDIVEIHKDVRSKGFLK